MDLAGNGCNALGVALDVCDEVGAGEAFQRVVEEFGRLDALINNAGTDRTASIEELEVTDFDRILAVNLRGPVVMSKLAFPHMQKQKWGRIVNIAGAAGTSPTTGNLAASFANVTILNLTRAFQDVIGDQRDRLRVIEADAAFETPRRDHRRHRDKQLIFLARGQVHRLASNMP